MQFNKIVSRTIALTVCCLSLTGCLKKKNKKIHTATTPFASYENKRVDPFAREDVKSFTHKSLPSEQKVYYFGLNSDVLDSHAKGILNSISQYLQKHPEISVALDGHADNRGPNNFNDWLSKKRADSVKVYLRNQDIEDERIETYGHSNRSLVALGNNETDHAKNRRVELKFVE